MLKIVLLSLFFILSLFGNVEKPLSSDYITLEAIPTKAIQVQTDTDTIFKFLQEHHADTKETIEQLKKSQRNVDEILHSELNDHLDKLNTKTLQKSYNTLETYLLHLKEINTQLEARIQEYTLALKKIKEFQKLWKNTLSMAKKQNAPQEIIENISNVLKNIDNAKSKLQADFDNILTLINKISIYILNIQKLQEKITIAQTKIANNVLQQNELPYHIMYQEQTIEFVPYIQNIIHNIQENFKEFSNYLLLYTDKIWLFIFISLPLAMFIWYFNYLYRKKSLFIRKESLQKKSFFFIKRPFSTFLILIVFCNLFIFPDMSKVVKDTELLFIIIPIFRIIQTLTPQNALNNLYIFFTLYITFIFNKDAVDSTLLSRTIAIFLALALIMLIYQTMKKRVLEKTFQPLTRNIIRKLFWFDIVLLAISLIANLYGATNLSNRLLEAGYTIVYSGLLFYALTTILSGYIIVLLRRHMATATNLIEEFAIKVEKNTLLFIKVIMAIWWIKVILDVLGIYNFLIEKIKGFLAIRFEISNFSISIQSIFDFFLIIITTWFLAKFITTFLEVEIFSRYKFPRGIPTAIKTLLNYIIIFIGSLIALSALGISSEQFMVVFGALGVGIGFGLRNIIANFISGIIMVFERPVQIGDVIQITSTMGKVKSIGARSTTIETYDGSEVIIPNADFISKEITNWTFSDDRRRKSLEFKTDFGNDIEQILKIMEEVALRHPDVLKEPKPLATFQGFGEYYLEFKLYFWLSENLVKAQSEVAIETYKALVDAGISMPIPKQENFELQKEDPIRKIDNDTNIKKHQKPF